MATTIMETMPVAPQELAHMKLQSKTSINMMPHPPAMPKMKLRLDPQRALEPSRKKLSTVEAQRIMASLAEGIKRTELISALPFIIENIERYRIMIGADLIRLLESHKVIIESFSELKESAEKLMEKEQKGSSVVEEEESEAERNVRGGSPKTLRNGSGTGSPGSRRGSSSSITSQLNMTMRNLALVAKQMQFSCKNILRAFSTDPSALNAVLKVGHYLIYFYIFIIYNIKFIYNM